MHSGPHGLTRCPCSNNVCHVSLVKPPLRPDALGCLGELQESVSDWTATHRSSLLGDVATRCPTSTSFDRGAWRVASRLAAPFVFSFRTPLSGDGCVSQPCAVVQDHLRPQPGPCASQVLQGAPTAAEFRVKPLGRSRKWPSS